MRKNKLIIGCTEPSQFIDHIVKCIEDVFDANPFKICANRAEDVRHWVKMCDGIILAGGKDIHPRLYAKSVTNDSNFSSFDYNRDRREVNIINACIEYNIPILGICRGHQMLGIYHNLPLIPDLSTGQTCHNPQAQRISFSERETMHWVKLTEDGLKNFVINSDRLTSPLSKQKPGTPLRGVHVNSFHHQGIQYDEKIDYAANGVMVMGWATSDEDVNIVELMKGTQRPWISCQWHPEFDYEQSDASLAVLERFKSLLNDRK